MVKVKVTYGLDEAVVRAARVRAARTDQRDAEVVEEALRAYLDVGILEELWAAAEALPPTSLDDVVAEQHEARADQRAART
jgi:hypothetical protein